MRFVALAALALVAGGGCRSKEAPAAPVADAAPAVSADPVAPVPPAPPAPDLPRLDTGPLWSLATDEIKLGVVFADGAFVALGAGTREIGRVLGEQPEGQALWSRWVEELREAAGFELHDTARWPRAGLDPERGAAFFVTADDRVAVAVPVGDLAAHRRFFNLAPRAVAGRELDYSARTGYCGQARGRYLCSDDAALLGALLDGKPGSLARRARALPPALRGSFELVADLSAFPGAAGELADLGDVLTGVGLVAVAARADGGRVAVEAWLAGQRSGRVGEAFRALAPARPLAPHLAGATGVVSLRLPLRELIPSREIPPAMPIGDVDLKPIVFDQMTGQISMITAGEGVVSGTLVIGLADEKPLAAALPRLCAIGRRFAAEAVYRGGSCRAAVRPDRLGVPIPGLPSALRAPIPIEITTAPRAALIRVGEPGKAAAVAPPPFVTGDGHFVSWGRSFDPLATAPAKLAGLVSAILESQLGSGEVRRRVDLARWALNHLHEIGVRARLDPDGIRASLLVTSFAADAPATYAAYQAAARKLIEGDVAGYRAAMKALAAAHPGTIAAEQAALVESDAPAIGLGTGIYAAVGIPAFMKFLDRARQASTVPSPPVPPGDPL